MSIKIALLKSGEQVITDIKELLSEDKPVGYLFKDPEKIAINKPFLVQEDVIDNSVDVGATEVNIHYEMDRENGCRYLIIADNGAGMDEKTMQESMYLGIDRKRETSELGQYRTIRCGLPPHIFLGGRNRITSNRRQQPQQLDTV